MKIFTTQYFGDQQLFSSLIQDQCCLEQHENYQKRSPRNRCAIMSSNGIEYLSVPLLKGKHNQSKIKAVKVAYQENWMRNHLAAIKSAYGSSAFLEFYIEDIEALLMEEHEYLWDLNMSTMNWVKKKLKIDTEFKLTNAYYKDVDNDFRDMKLMNNSSFLRTEASQIQYAQVFEYKFGFTPRTSILDLLFCTGPEAKYYL